METQQWLAELRVQLAKRRLPPLYVERIVDELTDHLTDCVEDRMSTDAKDLRGVFQRLGAPQQVAAGAAQEYRKTRFAGRHPILMFVVLPVLSLPVLWIGYLLLVIGLAKMLGLESGSTSSNSPLWQWASACVPYLMLGMVLVPVTVAAAFFSRVARRSAVHWKWSLAACGLLAVLGGMAMAQMALPTATTQGSLRFGFGISTHPSASQVLQFLLPLAIGGWAVWRQVSSRQQSQSLAG